MKLVNKKTGKIGDVIRTDSRDDGEWVLVKYQSSATWARIENFRSHEAEAEAKNEEEKEAEGYEISPDDRIQDLESDVGLILMEMDNFRNNTLRDIGALRKDYAYLNHIMSVKGDDIKATLEDFKDWCDLRYDKRKISGEKEDREDVVWCYKIRLMELTGLMCGADIVEPLKRYFKGELPDVAKRMIYMPSDETTCLLMTKDDISENDFNLSGFTLLYYVAAGKALKGEIVKSNNYGERDVYNF